MTIYPRPAIVTGLAVIHIALGSLLVLLGLLGDIAWAEYIMLPNIRPEVLRTVLVIDGVLTFVGGLLMWKGPRIAWFYAIVLFVGSAVRNAAGFVLIEDVLDEFGMPAAGIEFYYMEYVIRAVIAVACVPLFMTRPVADYFGVDERKERGYVWAITLACIVLAVGIYFVRQWFV